jgi:hypothetical protein
VKEARIPAAKRIGAQLASHTSKGSVTPTPASGDLDDGPLDAVDDGDALSAKGFDLDVSSTEPSSDAEDHVLWEQREEIQEKYRKTKKMSALPLTASQWEDDFQQEIEHYRREEGLGHHKEPEYRCQEEGRRRGEEEEHEEPDYHRWEGEHFRGEERKASDHRREGRHERHDEEAEHRDEANHREEAARHKEAARREEAAQAARHKETAHCEEAARREEAERHREADCHEHRNAEQEIEQPLKLPRVNLKVSQKKPTHSSKKRLVCLLFFKNNYPDHFLDKF